MADRNLPALRDDSVIVRLESARTALAEAKTIQQSKSIADVAAAAEIYARRQQLGQEAIDFAHAIKIEALRKVGEMLQETPRNKGPRLGGTKVVPPGNEPTLADLGLDKKTSSMAQKLAELPPEQFEAVRDGHESIGKAIAKVAEKRANPGGTKSVPPENDEALRQQVADLEERNAELASQLKEATEDNASMARAFEADDKLAAAMAEAKRYREMNRVLEERVRGLQNEKNETIRSAKSWQRKAEART